MRSFFTLLLFGAVLLVSAQNIGHVNSAEILSLMPEVKKVQKELERLGKTYEDELKTLATELQNKLAKYNEESPNKGDAINASRTREIRDLQQRIEEYRKNAASDIQQKQKEMMDPVQKRLQKALDKVRRSKKLDYIFDLVSGSIVSFNTSKDVSKDVKKILKIKG